MKNKCIICEEECSIKYCSEKCKWDAHNHKNKIFKEPIINVCECCKKKFKTTIKNPNQEYCSLKCRRKVNRKINHKKYVETDRKYYERNVERINKVRNKRENKNRKIINKQSLVRVKKNMDKVISRSETRKVVVFNDKWKEDIGNIKRICKICGSSEHLEFHHEVYPKNREAIREALRKGLIYYLCGGCHGKTMRIEI